MVKQPPKPLNMDGDLGLDLMPWLKTDFSDLLDDRDSEFPAAPTLTLGSSDLPCQPDIVGGADQVRTLPSCSSISSALHRRTKSLSAAPSCCAMYSWRKSKGEWLKENDDNSSAAALVSICEDNDALI